VELHAIEIATKKHLWGGVFAKRRYLPGSGMEEVDVSSIPVKLRELMQEKLRGRIADSMKASPKLGTVKTVAILPVVGDVRGYASALVRDAVSRTALVPKNLDILTFAEARYAMRDNDAADAILYGSMRDLSVWTDMDSPLSEDKLYSVELQLCMESAKTREQLWSETVLVSEKDTKDGWWYAATRYFPVLKTRPWLAVVVPIFALAVIVMLLKVLRLMTRVR